MLTSLGLDGPVGDDDDGPFEFVLEVLNHLVADLAEVVQGPERDPDQDVPGHLTIGLLKFDFFSGVEVYEFQVLLEVWAARLEGDKGLSDLLLEVGGSFLK